jgi:hypothetical protein
MIKKHRQTSCAVHSEFDFISFMTMSGNPRHLPFGKSIGGAAGAAAGEYATSACTICVSGHVYLNHFRSDIRKLRVNHGLPPFYKI